MANSRLTAMLAADTLPATHVSYRLTVEAQITATLEREIDLGPLGSANQFAR